MFPGCRLVHIGLCGYYGVLLDPLGQGLLLLLLCFVRVSGASLGVDQCRQHSALLVPRLRQDPSHFSKGAGFLQKQGGEAIEWAACFPCGLMRCDEGVPQTWKTMVLSSSVQLRSLLGRLISGRQRDRTCKVRFTQVSRPGIPAFCTSWLLKRTPQIT